MNCDTRCRRPISPKRKIRCMPAAPRTTNLTTKAADTTDQCGSFFYNAFVKPWDVIVVGGGIIGLSIARELRKHGAEVLVVERGEPGREASHAAGGMLANCGDETPAALQPLSQT